MIIYQVVRFSPICNHAIKFNLSDLDTQSMVLFTQIYIHLGSLWEGPVATTLLILFDQSERSTTMGDNYCDCEQWSCHPLYGEHGVNNRDPVIYWRLVKVSEGLDRLNNQIHQVGFTTLHGLASYLYMFFFRYRICNIYMYLYKCTYIYISTYRDDFISCNQ